MGSLCLCLLFQNWPPRRVDHLSAAYLWISFYISVCVCLCLARTYKCVNLSCPPLMPCQYDYITKPVKINAWLTGTDTKCSTCWSNICCIVNCKLLISMLRVVICNLSRCYQIAEVSSQKDFPSLFICRFVKYTRWRWKFRFNTFLWLDQAFGWLLKMVKHENNITLDTFFTHISTKKKIQSYYLINRINARFFSSIIIQYCTAHLAIAI